MKIFGIIILSGILMACSHKSVEKEQTESKVEEAIPVKIKIKKTDGIILSPYAIDCDEFDEWVRDHMSLHIIENKDSIDLFMNTIKELEKKDRLKSFPDIRTKLFVFYQNQQIDTICMNMAYVIINGEPYTTSQKMMDLIEGL